MSLPSVTHSTQDITEVEILNQSESVFGVSPCHFQAASCQRQLRGQHSILISPTGSGKSLTCFLPFIWQQTGVSLLICPLQLLGEQHAGSLLLHKLGIKSINLTARTASDSVFKVIHYSQLSSVCSKQLVRILKKAITNLLLLHLSTLLRILDFYACGSQQPLPRKFGGSFLTRLIVSVNGGIFASHTRIYASCDTLCPLQRYSLSPQHFLLSF
jgi:hypothetical protein